MEDNNSIVFMFSGQGSQFYQMGKELFQDHSVFRNSISYLNEFILDQFEFDVITPLYKEERSKPLDHTLLSHCALFMTEYSLAKALMSEGVQPDIYLGASLGEFVSAALSGAVTPTDILENLISQAMILDEQCAPGTMLAILENTSLFYENTDIFKNCDLASINFDKHFVIGTENSELIAIQEFLTQKNITHQVLNVPHAFHSRSLDIAMPSYMSALQDIQYTPPSTPLFSCMRAQEVSDLDSRYFWSVIREPIEFQKSILRLENQSDHMYIDLGPSGTLATFTNYILSDRSLSRTLPCMTPFTNPVDSFYSLVDTINANNLT